MLALVPLQNGDSVIRGVAERLYGKYVHEADQLNRQFDRETNHGINKEVEAIWEEKISRELLTFGNSSKAAHAGNR